MVKSYNSRFSRKNSKSSFRRNSKKVSRRNSKKVSRRNSRKNFRRNNFRKTMKGGSCPIDLKNEAEMANLSKEDKQLCRDNPGHRGTIENLKKLKAQVASEMQQNVTPVGTNEKVKLITKLITNEDRSKKHMDKALAVWKKIEDPIVKRVITRNFKKKCNPTICSEELKTELNIK